MATKSIAWTTGTGNITLTYSGQGDDTVVVTSDPNDLTTTRSQTITFSTTAGSPTVTRQVTVTQAGKPGVVTTVTSHPVSYDSSYVADSVSYLQNGYTDADSTTNAKIYLVKGNLAETYIYYNFDFNIPAGATIKSVSCECKCQISTTSATRITTRQVRLYSGSTAMGTAYTLSTSSTKFNIAAGTWTAAQLNNAKIRLYAKRGTSRTTTDYNFSFYGALMTVEYEI